MARRLFPFWNCSDPILQMLLNERLPPACGSHPLDTIPKMK